jgi:hypothetical protein
MPPPHQIRTYFNALPSEASRNRVHSLFQSTLIYEKPSSCFQIVANCIYLYSSFSFDEKWPWNWKRPSTVPVQSKTICIRFLQS